MAIPRNDNELIVWLNTFSTAFATHATALGFTTAEVNSVNADAAMVSFLVGDFLPTYKSALRAGITYKERVITGPLGTSATPPPTLATITPPAAVPPGILARLRNLVQRIQLAPGYSEEIGLALGIAGTGGGGPSAPDATPKPTLKVQATSPGLVQLSFSKERYDGVIIESRRPGEEDWQQLGIDNYSPYIDDRPPLEAGKPERREYRVRYILRDQATGEWSDIVTATYVP